MLKLLAREIRYRMKNATCSKVGEFLRNADLMVNEKDKFILKNMFYKKESALNTAIMLGGYTEKGIIYRLDNIIIKHNYDIFMDFLKTLES